MTGRRSEAPPAPSRVHDVIERIVSFSSRFGVAADTAKWPASLATVLQMLTEAGQAAWLVWGDRRALAYNDKFGALLGNDAFGNDVVDAFENAFAEAATLTVSVLNGITTSQGVTVTAGGEVYRCTAMPVRGNAGEIEGVFGLLSPGGSEKGTTRRDDVYALFRQSPAHIHVLRGPQHVVEFFHPLGVRFIGRDLTGMRIREAVPELLSKGYFEMLDDVYQNGNTVKLNESPAVFRNEDGTEETYYFDITYLPWRDAQDRIQGVMQFSFEVTDQVRARQKVQENEERLRIASENLGLGTWDYDPARDAIHCSNKTLEIFGFPSEMAVTIRDVFSIIVPEDAAAVREAVARTLKEGVPYDVRYSFIHYLRGDVRTVQANGRVFHDDQRRPCRFIGTVIDITDAIHAERALRSSEERFRILTQSISQIVWTTDANGIVDFISDQWEQYTGQEPASGITSFATVIHPDDMTRLKNAWTESIARGEGWEGEYRIFNQRTGEYRWFLGKSLPLKNETGQIVKWIGSASDIQSLKEQSGWLEEQVRQRTAALQKLNKSLSASNEDLQQFAHVASHDLREPVRKVRTFGNRLMEEYGDAIGGRGRDYLERMLHATNRMYAMIEGVLAYSSVGAAEEPFAEVDLNGVLRDIRVDLEVLLQERRVTLEASALPVIYGAPVLLYQLFYNLITNSIKFSKQDTDPRIHIDAIRSRNSPESFEIIVRDNGIGFDEKDAAVIFNTFTRLNAKDRYEGTGLGLALCRKIVERHNGTISAHGTPGEGAVFTIRLPLQPGREDRLQHGAAVSKP